MSEICSDCGKTEPLTGSYFISAYPPFEAWSPAQQPAFQRALDEAGRSGVPFGIYLHIPFCEKRCDFCYYLSYADQNASEIDAYLSGIAQEARLYARSAALAGREVDFLYVGGGTPSLLSRPRIARLFDDLAAAGFNTVTRETSFECAPRSVTPEKLELLRSRGVNRISLGVQQWDDRILALNGRVHRSADIERALGSIRATGFDTVNCDLIAGLVGETDQTFFDSLEKLLEHEPDSITIYQLEIPHNTPLFQLIEYGDGTGPSAETLEVPSWEEKRRRLDGAFERLERCGYVIRSGYCAVKDRSRHTFLYQDEQYRGADLIGLGASAFSYLSGVHQQNAASLDDYLAGLKAGGLPTWRAYALTPREQLFRELVLQLKLGVVQHHDLAARHGLGTAALPLQRLRELEERGLLRLEEDRIEVTRSGLISVDRWLPELFPTGTTGGSIEPENAYG